MISWKVGTRIRRFRTSGGTFYIASSTYKISFVRLSDQQVSILSPSHWNQSCMHVEIIILDAQPQGMIGTACRWPIVRKIFGGIVGASLFLQMLRSELTAHACEARTLMFLSLAAAMNQSATVILVSAVTSVQCHY